MTTLFLIVLANMLSRVLAVGLAAVLSFRIFSRCGNLVAAFAAGLLLTIACTHLIPEAVESGIDAHLAGGVLLGAFVFFMLLECFFSALGGHSHGDVKIRPVPVLLGGGTRVVQDSCCRSNGAQVPVLLAGTACHSFVDGVLVEVIGQIVILMQAGIEKRRAAIYVFAVSLACVLGGIAGWAVLSVLNWLIGYAMLVSAASFIFVVLAILLPELMHLSDAKQSKLPVGVLTAVLAGVAVSYLILQPLHEETHRLTEASAVHEHIHVDRTASDDAEKTAH